MKRNLAALIVFCGSIAAYTQTAPPSTTTPRSDNAEALIGQAHALRVIQPWNLNASQLSDLANFAHEVKNRMAAHEKERTAALARYEPEMGRLIAQMAAGGAGAESAERRIGEIETVMSGIDRKRDSEVENLVQRAVGLLKPDQKSALWYTPARKTQAEQRINEIRSVPQERWQEFSQRYVMQQMGRRMRDMRNVFRQSTPGENNNMRGRRGNNQMRQEMQPYIEQMRAEALRELEAIRTMPANQVPQAAFQMAQQEMNAEELERELMREMRELLTNPQAQAALTLKLRGGRPAQ